MKKDRRKILDVTLIAVTILVFTFMFGSAFNTIKELNHMNLGTNTAVVQEEAGSYASSTQPEDASEANN